MQASVSATLDNSIGEMMAHFKGNEWFVDRYWPENEPRVKALVNDLKRLVPAGGRVFEPGCGNGYISFLAARAGFKVTAADAWQPEQREELFASAGVEAFVCNLNVVEPWPNLADSSFDAVVFGEVFEHILNHPLGLLREIGRILKPDGILLLTTPNPSTMANAIRVLLDRHSMWGTEVFANSAKFSGGEIIDKGEVHYREYRQSELRAVLQLAGFDVLESGYMPTGSPRGEPMGKRLMKKVLGRRWMYSRLFALSHYVVARKRE